MSRLHRVRLRRSLATRLALALAVALAGACATQVPNRIWGTTQQRAPVRPKALPESFGYGRETVAVVLYLDPTFDPGYIAIPSPAQKGGEGAGNAVSALWDSCLPPAVGLAAGSVLVVPFILAVGLLAGCTVATPFVAIDGAVRGRAKPTKEARLAKTEIRASVASVIDHNALVEAVLGTAKDQTPHALRPWKFASFSTRDLHYQYEAMAREGIDTALELEPVPEFALREEESGHPLTLRIEVNARLVSVRDEALLYNETFVFCCESRAESAWAADDGRMLRELFAIAYPSLGERIAEEIFLTYPIGKGGIPAQPPVFGLRPSYPPLDEGSVPPQIETRQPTLAWEPLALNGASNVSYELRVAQLREGRIPSLAYSRAGMGTPSHALEAPLEAGARYLWSVRARFELGGRRRVTEWGYQAAREPSSFPQPDLVRRTAPVPNTYASPDGGRAWSYRFSVAPSD